MNTYGHPIHIPRSRLPILVVVPPYCSGDRLGPGGVSVSFGMFRGERWTDILNWSCKGGSEERCGCDENIKEIHYIESSGRDLRKTVAVREWKC